MRFPYNAIFQLTRSAWERINRAKREITVYEGRRRLIRHLSVTDSFELQSYLGSILNGNPLTFLYRAERFLKRSRGQPLWLDVFDVDTVDVKNEELASLIIE